MAKESKEVKIPKTTKPVKSIGIDFGTSHICVCVIDCDGKDKVVSTSQGKRAIPTILSFTDREVLFGDEAKEKLINNPENTIFDLDRILGREFSDPKLQVDIRTRGWPFKIVDDGKNNPLIEVLYKGKVRQFSVKELYTFIFLSLGKIIGGVDDLVNSTAISVPSHLSSYQKTIVGECGKAAGFNVRRITNNLEAVVLGYINPEAPYYSKKEEATGLLVLNFGASGLDCATVNLDDNIAEIFAFSVEKKLSASSIEHILVDHFIDEFKRKHDDFGEIVNNHRAMFRLRLACEKLKCKLSISSTAVVEIDSLWHGLNFVLSLTRSRFEELCVDVFQLVVPTIKNAETKSLLQGEVAQIILTGGLSRIPKIQELVRDYFSKSANVTICRGMNVEECVATGAAFYAQALDGAKQLSIDDHLLLSVTVHSFGIGDQDGLFRTDVIGKNDTIPCKKNIVTSPTPRMGSEWTIFENSEIIGRIKVGATSSAMTIVCDLDSHGKLSIIVEDRNNPSLSVLVEMKRPSLEEVTGTCKVAHQLEKDCLDEKKRAELLDKLELSICEMQKITSTTVTSTEKDSCEEIQEKIIAFKSDITSCLEKLDDFLTSPSRKRFKASN